ncbi:MAG: hypothetical protein JXX29_08580 [Deltaproteobacteria bacterium]|nr:hypothetical protein [Deltaproteobacteria bacterium]MBN2671716.1 hypothetical protein [Deltaproteobacteria bacterium]
MKPTTTFSFLSLSFFLFAALTVGCKTPPPPKTQNQPAATQAKARSNSPSAPKMNPQTCDADNNASGWHFHIFRVYQDGLDVGREVRTTFPSNGPMGPEEITISHMATRHKSHDVEIDRFTIETERFLKENNTFLRGCVVMVDEASVHLALVGFNGAEWEKVHDNLDTIESPLTKAPSPLPLNGDELIGHKLLDHLQQIAASPDKPLYNENRSFFMPKIQAPVALDFTEPQKDTLRVNGQKVPGHWVSALRSGTRRVVVKMFVGTDGVVYEEHYPSLHQKRVRTEPPLELPTEYATPYRGLFSNAYLGFPDGATNATYRIVSKEPIQLEEFAFIGEPANQTITLIDDNTLELRVTAGGPDGNSAPTSKDLSSTQYVQPGAKTIRDALAYLKSGGKKGFLPAHRCENAVPVMAKAAGIRKPSNFWKDPDKAAELIAEYVHALLPTKHHTHTMKDAVTTLKDGLGDCTEHSVLFASLMRAAKIPTKLVSGMYLTHGGAWVFHMWNEYWDGSHWKSIDAAVGPKMKTGANYVALSRGAAGFDEHRHNISFFLDRSFSGLEFNLVAAGAQGESLYLAKPKRIAFSGNDAVIFQALTLSNRGDYIGAFNFVEQQYQPNAAPLNLELLRADLFFKVGNTEEALREIRRLRQKTSLPINVFMLDKLEFDLHLQEHQMTQALAILEHLAESIGENEPLFLEQKARYLFADGDIEQALTTIDNALIQSEFDTKLLATYVELVARAADGLSEATRRSAVDRAWKGLYLSHYAAPTMLKAAARLFFALGQYPKALPLIQHALVMTPNDAELNQWLHVSTTACL